MSDTILEEAQSIVYGDRERDYSHPYDDYKTTAALWSAILGVEVTIEQAILCMIAVKISRECRRPKRDNRVDMAGYAECLQRVADRRAETEQTRHKDFSPWTGTHCGVYVEVDPFQADSSYVQCGEKNFGYASLTGVPVCKKHSIT